MRFRPQGRGVHGIDCVGVIVAAAHAVNAELKVRSDYQMGRVDFPDVVECLQNSLCARIPIMTACEGGLFLSRPDWAQAHFAVKVPGGLVEVHLGLRRVVDRSIALDEQFQSAWRLPEWEGKATPLDEFSYRLTGLLRGRLATEHEMLEHLVGTQVTVIEREGLLPLAMGRDLAGREIALRAVGAGDPAGGTFSSVAYEELGHEKLAVTHPMALRANGGDIIVSWIPRSASGWSWGGAVSDQPVTIRFHRPGQAAISNRVGGPSYRYELADQLKDFGAAFSGQIEIIADGVGSEAGRCRTVELG